MCVCCRWVPPEDGATNRSVALSNEAIGGGNEGADLLEKKADDDLDENVATQVELGRVVEFVLNIRAASRSWRSWRALWCPGIVVAVHKKPTRSSALAGAFPGLTHTVPTAQCVHSALDATDRCCALCVLLQARSSRRRATPGAHTQCHCVHSALNATDSCALCVCYRYKIRDAHDKTAV